MKKARHPRKAEEKEEYEETRIFFLEIFYLPFFQDRVLRKWLKGLFRVDYSFREALSGNVVKKLDYCLIGYLITLPPNIDT